MKRKLVLKVKPFSINALHYANKSHGLTAAAKEWTYQVFNALSSPDNRAALSDLRSYFDPTKHAITVGLTVFYPEKIFWNLQGTISAKTQDNSNWEKPLIDCIFLPGNFGSTGVYNAENMNCDDRYITRLFSQKKPGTEHRIDVRIGIIALPVRP